MGSLTNLAVVNEKECVRAIFSKELVTIAKLIAKYSVDIGEYVLTQKDVGYIMILLDYVDCHDFDKHVISADYENRVPFPYLPTTLLSDEKSKNISIKGLDVNFPTFCTALYIKDLQILSCPAFFFSQSSTWQKRQLRWYLMGHAA